MTTQTATSTITKLVNDHTAELLAYAKARVKDATSADDLVQETFLAAYKGWDNFNKEASARTWLFSILKNKLMDHYRKHYREAEKMVSTDDFFDADGNWKPEAQPRAGEEVHLLDNAEFNRVLLHCRKLLPENLFAVIQMKYYSELDADHICKELNISPTNYWQLMHRAKLKLRDCLQKNWTNG
ncbi:MAG: sigma-70 family RNA polymerase sigma factor [Flavobacteriales bacterium]|nr:sigma-70 family RNA polymerase sigma factor [Flavobacteriales bacterium]